MNLNLAMEDSFSFATRSEGQLFNMILEKAGDIKHRQAGTGQGTDSKI